MDNNNPLQPGSGSLPQPTAYADATNPLIGTPQEQVSAQGAPSSSPSLAGLSGVPNANSVQQNTLSTTPPAPSSQNATPAATDTDDINPQWLHMVEGLKRQYAQDPRVFAREFEKLKAQYITGRYGKEVKQTEDET